MSSMVERIMSETRENEAFVVFIENPYTGDDEIHLAVRQNSSIMVEGNILDLNRHSYVIKDFLVLENSDNEIIQWK